MSGVILSVDLMGGDDAPRITLEGLLLMKKASPDVRFIMYGDEKAFAPFRGSFSSQDEFIHTDGVIGAEDKPSQAIRQSKGSSMRLAIEAVKNGQAHGVVSAGNTGAYMALSKIILKTIEGIDRPAISAILPTLDKDIVALDLGANVSCSAENLIQFSMMGEVFARKVLKRKDPSVGLLNIGSEELKGHAVVQEAHRLLTEGPYIENFYGFVEGDDLGRGTTDIVVTDGFTGNVALKAIEGTAVLMYSRLKESLTSSLFSKLGLVFLRPSLKRFRQYIDPRRYNGAIFLGLNGIVVKSHGGTDAIGFFHALETAVDMVKNGVNDHIRQELSQEDMPEKKSA